jgi:hypothetical protein
MAPSRSKSLDPRRAFLCPLSLATDCSAAELALPENDPEETFTTKRNFSFLTATFFLPADFAFLVVAISIPPCLCLGHVTHYSEMVATILR